MPELIAMKARYAFVSAAILLASACAEPIDRSKSEEVPLPVEADGGAGDGAAALPPAALTIPADFQGRWGLTQEDCTSTRGDAKGLIEVTEEAIRFYESRGTLDKIAEGAERPGVFRATFAFSGEGETWSREMQLAVSDDGSELVRSEFGEGAIAEPLTYAKCKEAVADDEEEAADDDAA